MRSRARGRDHAAEGCSVLYRAEAFDPLTDRAWDEGWVRGEIERIVADADASFDADGLWPAEEWDSWQNQTPLKSLYVGAAGVVWALGALQRRGHAESRLDLAEAARDVLTAWRAEPDLHEGHRAPLPRPRRPARGRVGHSHRRLAALS